MSKWLRSRHALVRCSFSSGGFACTLLHTVTAATPHFPTTRVAGYSCTLTDTTEAIEFNWRNSTHYGTRKTAVSIDNITVCTMALIEPKRHVGWDCVQLYESGWTCANGVFNVDLLMFDADDVDDCELHDVITEVSVLGLRVLEDWDYWCADLAGHGVKHGRIDLNSLHVTSLPPAGATTVVIECTRAYGRHGKFALTWDNMTHMGAGGLLVKKDKSWECGLAEITHVPSKR